MSEVIKPRGIITFKPHENAPSFVKGVMKIAIDDLLDFCNENENQFFLSYLYQIL